MMGAGGLAQYIFDGNSHFAGTGVDGITVGVNDCPTLCMPLLRPGTKLNIAVSGSSGGHSGYAVTPPPLAAKTYILINGTNELNAAGGNMSAAALLAANAAIVSAVRATGVTRVYLCTCFASSVITGGQETARGTYNAALVANAGGIYGDAIVDIAAEAWTQTTGDTTYFEASGVHFTPLGNALFAALIASTLNPLL